MDAGIIVIIIIVAAVIIGGAYIAMSSRGPKGDESEDGAEAPVGVVKEAPPGATMVLSTVPRAAAWLMLRRGGDQGKIFELMRGQATIGSGEGSDIVVEHPSVGSPHALIKVQQNRYQLYDLGSSSGTWVNGKGVTGAFLRDGSRISMGATEIFFTQIGDADVRPGQRQRHVGRRCLPRRSLASERRPGQDGRGRAPVRPGRATIGPRSDHGGEGGG